MRYGLKILVVMILAASGTLRGQEDRVGQSAPVLRLLPIDEASRDPSFLEFRQRLVEVAERRDKQALLGVVDPKIMLTPYAQDGAEVLAFFLAPDNPLWGELLDVLRLGGSFEERANGLPRFCAPYVYSRFPSNLPDEYIGEINPWVIIGSNVAVRAQPSLTADVIGRLSYDLVRYLDDVKPYAGPRADWVQILTPAGRRGYVSRSLIRSTGDYYACFEKSNESGWRMVEFLPGTS